MTRGSYDIPMSFGRYFARMAAGVDVDHRATGPIKDPTALRPVAAVYPRMLRCQKSSQSNILSTRRLASVTGNSYFHRVEHSV